MSQIKIADLDHDGVYWGLKDAILEELVAGAVVFCARALLEPTPVDPVPVDATPDDAALGATEVAGPLEKPAAIVIPEGIVWLGEDCDLAPGAYRWNAKARSFDPLPVPQRKALPMPPSLERALVDYFAVRIDELPTSTRAWLEWQQSTIDEKGRK